MGRHKEFDEDLVQAKAMSLFWQNGFHKTTLACLARETGIKRGSLYNAYASKENIFLEAFKKHTDCYLEDIREALQIPSIEEALKRLFDVAIQLMREGTPAHGCLTTRIIMEATDDMEEIRSCITDYLDSVEEELRKAFSRARTRGEFRGNPEISARLVITVTRGMAVLERAYTDERRLRETAEETIRLLLNR